jgi:hypothetical protein
MKTPKLLICLSDLHCGSVYGLCPPGLQLYHGSKYTLNAGQEWLWQCWQQMVKDVLRIAGKHPFAVLFNGDLVEGIHHKSTEVISGEWCDHVAAAVGTCREIAKYAEKIYVVEGTECHTQTVEAGIGEDLGAEPNPETGLHAWPRLTLDAHGLRLVAQHHIGATSRPYLEAGGLSIALACEQLEALRNGEPIPQILISSHRHRAGVYRGQQALSIVTHAWQKLTRHGRKVVPHGRCLPGFHMLDWRGVPKKELPYVHTQTYVAPPAKGAKL